MESCFDAAVNRPLMAPTPPRRMPVRTRPGRRSVHHPPWTPLRPPPALDAASSTSAAPRLAATAGCLGGRVCVGVAVVDGTGDAGQHRSKDSDPSRHSFTCAGMLGRPVWTGCPAHCSETYVTAIKQAAAHITPPLTLFPLRQGARLQAVPCHCRHLRQGAEVHPPPPPPAACEPRSPLSCWSRRLKRPTWLRAGALCGGDVGSPGGAAGGAAGGLPHLRRVQLAPAARVPARLPGPPPG